MNRTELHEKFIYALEDRFIRRSELVAQTSDILKIERESANRRLSGKVQFSIREMGLLAHALGISIDGLIHDDISSYSGLIVMENPGTPICSDIKAFEEVMSHSGIWEKISEQPYSESGNVVSSLPIHIYIHYPLLMKFICFKRAYYIRHFRSDFGTYEVPANIYTEIKRFKENYYVIKYSFYIWNHSFILGVINDIKYFRSMGLLTQEEVDSIQVELNNMLNSLEAMFIADVDSTYKVEHYVSSVDMEVSASYIWSETYYHSSIFTFFLHSAAFSDQSKCLRIRDWVNSMKKVSTMISGSGEMARVDFLKYQRGYIESL